MYDDDDLFSKTYGIYNENYGFDSIIILHRTSWCGIVLKRLMDCMEHIEKVCEFASDASGGNPYVSSNLDAIGDDCGIVCLEPF